MTRRSVCRVNWNRARRVDAGTRGGGSEPSTHLKVLETDESEIGGCLQEWFTSKEVREVNCP